MKLSIEVDCTPEEARRFLGLPDVSALNDHLVSEMQKRIESNMAMLSTDELMKKGAAARAERLQSQPQQTTD